MVEPIANLDAFSARLLHDFRFVAHAYGITQQHRIRMMRNVENRQTARAQRFVVNEFQVAPSHEHCCTREPLFQEPLLQAGHFLCVPLGHFSIELARVVGTYEYATSRESAKDIRRYPVESRRREKRTQHNLASQQGKFAE